MRHVRINNKIYKVVKFFLQVTMGPQKRDTHPRKVNGAQQSGFFLLCRLGLIQIAGTNDRRTKPKIYSNAHQLLNG